MSPSDNTNNLTFFDANQPRELENVFLWGKTTAGTKSISNFPSGTCGVGRNAGIVVAKVLINRYCPILKGKLVNAPLVFGLDTIKSLNSDLKNDFRAVPGLEGIYLRERYIYEHNFIAKPNGESYDPTLEKNAKPFNKLRINKSLLTWIPVASPIDPQPPISKRDLQEACLGGGSLEVYNDVPVWTYIYDSRKTGGPRLLRPCMVTKHIDRGVHWKVDKEYPLFKGEDFFIDFQKVAELDQPSSIDESEEELEEPQNKSSWGYVSAEGLEKLVYKDPSSLADYLKSGPLDGDGTRPPNAGVASYKCVPKKSSGSEVIYEWEWEGSKYKFKEQSYIMIEIGQEGWSHFFIIITEDGPITFIKEVNQKSYNLGTYDAISGKDLLERRRFSITVRNHLGRIVIYFSGLEDNPWIVENKVRAENGEEQDTSNPEYLSVTDGMQETNEDRIFRVPEDAQINIWGGNCQYAFSYFPLCYIPDSAIPLPPSPKEGYKGGVFTLPDEGIYKHYILLSAFDEWPHGLRTSGHDKSVIYLDSTFEETRDPFFTCDAHEVREVLCDGIAYEDHVSYYVDKEEYIKDNNGNLSTIELHAEQVSEDAGVDSRYEWLQSTGTESEIDVISFKLGAELIAGGHQYSAESCGDDDCLLQNCKTPILTHVRLLSVPSDTPAWEENEVDVSDHVMSITDSWSSQDYSSCEHTANLKFLINKGHPELPHSEYLDSLKDRAFYIEVWAGYKGCSYVAGEDDLLFKLFTGICYGGTVQQEFNKRVLECKVVDYTQILKDTLFFNSPFFDGMRDINAVYEMLQITQMRFAGPSPPGIVPPAQYMHSMIKSSGNIITQGLDGRPILYSPFALPFSYDRLQNPFYRFQDGTNIWTAIQKIAKQASRMCYFDVHGGFHFENSAGILMHKVTNSNNLTVFVPWFFRSGDFELLNTNYQYIYNRLVKQGTVDSVYNNIHILTASPERELLIGDKINKESIVDRDSFGFIGYTKTLFQQEGFFGNVKALNSIMNFYASYFYPPAVMQFETYGQPIKAFDFIQLDGINLLVTSVSSEIVPDENKWWQNIEAEYVFSAEEVEE